MPPLEPDALNHDSIKKAQLRIKPYALLESPRLNERLGARLLVKAESLQVTGSFKFRGALNRILQLDEAERARGVVAFSSGNHAQAVAYASQLFGMTAVIVMPEDAPQVKIQKTREYGAEVVLYDRYHEDRAQIGAKLAADRGLTLIPPFDDTRIVAGQGTLGLEVCEQAAEKEIELDAFLVCCSGGGLTAGCSLAFEAESPNTQRIAVEPIGFDDTRRSLAAGHRVANELGLKTICDAIMTEIPGKLTFPINQRLLHQVLVVSDEEALEAVATAYNELKIVVEPGGAVALAAVLSGKLELEGRNIAVVCSGGNIDNEIFQRALNQYG